MREEGRGDIGISMGEGGEEIDGVKCHEGVDPVKSSHPTTHSSNFKYTNVMAAPPFYLSIPPARPVWKIFHISSRPPEHLTR